MPPEVQISETWYHEIGHFENLDHNIFAKDRVTIQDHAKAIREKSREVSNDEIIHDQQPYGRIQK